MRKNEGGFARVELGGSAFSEVDAAQFAVLIAGLKAKGQQMKFFDAGIEPRKIQNSLSTRHGVVERRRS